MTQKKTIPGTEDAWETKELGADENYVAVAEDTGDAAVDAALELQPISIRLQKSLIEDFKLIAQLRGVGYQPLMRQVLTRFADCEKKQLLREVASNAAKKQAERSDAAEKDKDLLVSNG
jgi:hypothetical protein